MPRCKQKSNKQAGSVIVELAISLPLLVLLVLSTVEITSMVFLQQSLKIAAYEATRVALVPGSDQGNVTATVDSILGSRGVTSTTVAVTPADFENQPYGTSIQVAVTADCSSNGLVPAMFYAGKTLTAEVTMMKEY